MNFTKSEKPEEPIDYTQCVFVSYKEENRMVTVGIFSQDEYDRTGEFHRYVDIDGNEKWATSWKRIKACDVEKEPYFTGIKMED